MYRDKFMKMVIPNAIFPPKSGSAIPGLLLVAATMGLIAAASGCSGSEHSRASAASAPPAPQVTVAEVVCKQISDIDEFTGRLEAVNNVEVRPRVSGYLQRVLFKEGAIVQKGDLLFEIDPRPFQAEVDRLKGDLAQAKAELSRAQNDFQRAERLHNNDGMSKEEYDRRAAAQNSAEARIASIEGSLRGAQLNLEFTRITAPITGRVGRAEITEGNLVESGPAQLKPLTTLVSLDPIYVYFDADEQTFLKYARSSRTKGGGSGELNTVVLLGLADEAGFPHLGHINFVDNQVSSTTGTIRVRGTFPNQSLALTPGLFARVRMQGAGSYAGCLAKDEAIVTDLSQKFVFVVGQNNTLERRPVTLGPLSEGLRVVRDGLHPGDVIVVNGLQRVRPGAQVSPTKVPMTEDSNTPKTASTQSSAKSPRELAREANSHE
jgi:multidrug efflux system membrane fusion protein